MGFNPQGSSSYSHFTGLPCRDDHVESRLMRTEHGYVRDLPTHFPPHFLPHPPNMQEAIRRQYEKEKIREEIIMSEIARMRALEAEVRRELMLERELVLRRGSNGFPFGSTARTGLDSSMRLSHFEARGDEWSKEGRMWMPHEGKMRPQGRIDSVGFETFPFQREKSGLRISETKPASTSKNEKEGIVLLPKPGENLSGLKRKAVTPPELDGSKHPSDVILNKQAKEWSCTLCQVRATSEKGLNEHLRGKMHKLNETALKDGKIPKKKKNPIPLVRTVREGLKCTGESMQGSSNLANTKRDQSEVTRGADNNGNLKNKEFKFWCEMCQIGTMSQKVMDNHKSGKKHNRELHRSKSYNGRFDVMVPA